LELAFTKKCTNPILFQECLQRWLFRPSSYWTGSTYRQKELSVGIVLLTAN
jgi:hypothetical protein